MSNIFDYIKEYGNKTFDEVAFNELDNLVFSQIVYINFTNIVSSDKQTITLNDAVKMYLRIEHKGTNKNRFNLIKEIFDVQRYRNLLLSNYIYKINGNEQFSALTIDINNNIRCVCFEGTDDTLMGWKEDFDLSYRCPIDAQKDAIKYLKKVSIWKKKLIVLGHSKGGNLALISSMYTNFYIRRKIIKIYSNDGPGLLIEQYNSIKYKKIKNKYIKIVSKNSIIGLLLHDSNIRVIDTNTIGLGAHSIFSWLVSGTSLIETNLSKSSIEVNTIINKWLSQFTYHEMNCFVNSLFNIFDECHIISLRELFRFDINTLEKIIKNTRNVDKKTRNMIYDFFKLVKNHLYSLITKEEN